MAHASGNALEKDNFYNELSHCYEASQAQEAEIERDIKASAPLLSAILPLSTLDCDFSGHDVYMEKLQLLKSRYPGIRRLRRDGNCFYRAFGFAFMEFLLKCNENEHAKRFLRRCDECRDSLVAKGYTEFTVEDFHDQFTDMVTKFTTGGGTLAELEETFNDQAYSDYYVVFLRLFVSNYMQSHEAFYSNFIDEGKTIRQFCETEVEPMARESDNIHVAALALAVGVRICVENCQQSGDLNQLEFPANADGVGDGIASDGVPVVTLPPSITVLYRPGHYDILYAAVPLS